MLKFFSSKPYKMKKIICIIAMALLSSISLKAQVGIGTETPQTTLHVIGKPSVTTVPDGVIAPSISGDQLRAKNNSYTANHLGTIIYVTAADTAPAGKTANVTAPGYYYFDGAAWQQLNDGNIYKNDGILSADRTINTNGKSLRFTGSGRLLADSEISSGLGGGTGRISLAPGTALRSGYLQIFRADGAYRLGYIGWDNTNLTYVTEGGASHIFNGGKVGIGTETQTPQTTFHVHGKPTITTEADGVIAPRLTRENLNNKTAYGAAQEGAIIYIQALGAGGTNTATAEIDTPGYYYYNGTVWKKLSGSSNYTGSTSVAIRGTSFERAALTGDVTAAANSNATTIAANAVTSAKILDGTIATADIANNAVTPAKIATPVRTVTASTTLADTDKGGFVYVNSGFATTITVPSTLAAGFHVVIVQQGTGQVTIAGSGVTMTTARGTKSRARYSAVGIIKQTTTEATITGDAVN